MTTYKIQKEIKFCAAHRLLNHEGHCSKIHGHNYKASIQVESNKLDAVGRVVDFGIIKKHVKSWIDDNWDHSFLVNENDTETINILQQLKGQTIFKLPNNPTAENMALYLLNICQLIFGELKECNVQVTAVTMWETDDSYATVEVPYIFEVTKQEE